MAAAHGIKLGGKDLTECEATVNQVIAPAAEALAVARAGQQSTGSAAST